MRIFKYFSIIVLLAVLALYLRSTFADYQEFGGKIFNTYYKVKLRTPLGDKKLPTKVRRALEDIDTQMSVFRTDSELSRLNRTPAGEAFALSAPLADVLHTARQINQNSNGAFDPAIAPLIDLWGFGPSHSLKNPSPSELKRVKSYSSMSKLRFSADGRTVTKTDSRTELNLSAIAKGYAVDKIAQILEDAGYKDYIVEIGGELRLSGTRDENGKLWNVGIGVPLQNSRANAMTLELSDFAVATSGDYRNFIEVDGQTFSHTISPQTGKPVQNNLASVTVFAPTCMQADAYATAIMSLGSDKGLKLAEKLKLPVILFIHAGEGGFTTQASSRAKELIGFDNETN